MEQHKRILGILYIVSATINCLVLIFVTAFISFLLSFIVQEADVKEMAVLEWIIPFIQVIALCGIVFFAIPSGIAGVGLLLRKSWALTLALIMGCFKLFSFPFGTALGIYTIWIYAENHRQQVTAQA
jgi:amino acid transporter